MKILVINGGARVKSRTRGLANAFAEALQNRDVELSYIDLGVDILPIYTGSEEQANVDTVKKLLLAAEQADGFVICTPEYHNGMSGALKNALDFLGGKHFKGKPTVIGAASGGGKGGINALNHLRQVLRGVYALVLPEQIAVDPEHFDDRLQICNEDILQRIYSIGQELVRITGSLSAKQSSYK
jgi:azobenzene reductase